MKIDRMFAFVAIDFAGDEGLCAFLDRSSGSWMPMVGADMRRVESLRAEAQAIANLSGKTIEVLEFSVRKTITTIIPRGK
jgi:hypothetical protein